MHQWDIEKTSLSSASFEVGIQKEIMYQMDIERQKSKIYQVEIENHFLKWFVLLNESKDIKCINA